MSHAQQEQADRLRFQPVLASGTYLPERDGFSAYLPPPRDLNQKVGVSTLDPLKFEFTIEGRPEPFDIAVKRLPEVLFDFGNPKNDEVHQTTVRQLLGRLSQARGWEVDLPV